MHRSQFLTACAVVTLVACPIVAVPTLPDDAPTTAPTAVSTTTPIRDTWYVLQDGDVTWGVTRLRIGALGQRAPEGAHAYMAESRTLIELMGTPQEMRGQSTVLVDADLVPLRIESEFSQMSGTVRVEGMRTEEGLLIRVTHGGGHGDEVKTSVHTLDDEIGLVADLSLETWLHRLPDTTTSTRVRLLHSAVGAVGEIDIELVERTADGVTWRIAPGEVPGEHTIRLDADGVGVEQLHRFPPLRIVRHPDASQIELTHRPFDDAELLMHRVDRAVPPLRRIAEMTIELRWKDIESDAFQLEDSRQHVKSIETSDGRTTATVVLRRPVALETDTLRSARTDADPTLLPYLAESDFIEPTEPEIVRTAAEIVGNQTSARAAAEALCEWVASAVQTTMIAETLSGSEVLRRRVGKCTEFATLYASLARAAGIPTRIALGMRLFGGGGGARDGAQWGGHMWNEVWLGEWVPVDASHGEFGGSPALLKVVHSDGVIGTQAVRWRLTESLAISILDVQTIPGGADDRTDLIDGVHDGVWTSVERGLRFRLPEEGWRVESLDAPGALLFRIRPPAESDPGASAMIHFSAFEFPPGMPVLGVHRARMSHQRSQVESLEILEEKAMIIAGADGHRCAFRAMPRNAPPVRATELLWSKDGTACLLNLICSEELHESWVVHLDRIAASFEFLPE